MHAHAQRPNDGLTHIRRCLRAAGGTSIVKTFRYRTERNSKASRLRDITGLGAIQKPKCRSLQPDCAVLKGLGPASRSRVLTSTPCSLRTDPPSPPGTSLVPLEAPVSASRTSFLCLEPPINGGHSFRIFCTRSQTAPNFICALQELSTLVKLPLFRQTVLSRGARRTSPLQTPSKSKRGNLEMRTRPSLRAHSGRSEGINARAE